MYTRQFRDEGHEDDGCGDERRGRQVRQGHAAADVDEEDGDKERVPKAGDRLDDVVAEARIPKDKITRTRQLIYADGDWTGTLGGLPINRTVQLVIIGTGPYGQETVYKDVSHVGPGDPIDKNDPYDLVGKDAERAIKEKMFDGEFEFDFDSAGKSSGDSTDQ